jgi:hypothetical protein
MTIDEAIKHCLEVAEENDLAAGTYELLAENNHNAYERLTAETNSSRCAECAADHRQLAEWLTELKNSRAAQNEQEIFIHELMGELEEAKRLLKAAVEDFAKLDRVNTKLGNCMIPDVGCADCPLNWDSVDDSVEPCHNWRYTNEAFKLIGGETDEHS